MATSAVGSSFEHYVLCTLCVHNKMYIKIISKYKVMLNKTIKKAKLYSPTVNKKFKKYSIRKKDYLKDCNLSRSIQKFQIPKIEINNRCEFVDTQKAKHLLKKNLYSKKLNSIHKIITPKQLNSNCWFNTFLIIGK